VAWAILAEDGIAARQASGERSAGPLTQIAAAFLPGAISQT
jgi:hypothetical protein